MIRSTIYSGSPVFPTSPLSRIQGMPPFTYSIVGDGAAISVAVGVILWSSRPPPSLDRWLSLSDVARPGSFV